MSPGIFAKTFYRRDFEDALDCVCTHGLTEVQFNLACLGMPTLPEKIELDQVRRVRRAFDSRGLTMSALSATFNLIHPNLAEREGGLRRLGTLAAVAHDMGTGILTLCTGSRHPENMWAHHPQNNSEEAWDDLVASMEVALLIAERHQVILAVEPEMSNVMSDAAKARRLLATFRSPWLKIVFDPANILPKPAVQQMQRVIGEALDILRGDIVLAHAKDLRGEGGEGGEAAGSGILDFDFYIRGLRRIGYGGAVILHGLAEDEVPASIRFLRGKLEANDSPHLC